MPLGGGELYLPAWLKNTILATAMMAAVATAMAEILGGAIALQMLFGIPIKLGSMIILVLVLICEFTSAYKRIEKLIIVFVSLIAFRSSLRSGSPISTGRRRLSAG